jgi:hypothetical protein
LEFGRIVFLSDSFEVLSNGTKRSLGISSFGVNLLMTVQELIDILKTFDPTKKVYVPVTTYCSPVSEPEVSICDFRDRDGVLICTPYAGEFEDDKED